MSIHPFRLVAVGSLCAAAGVLCSCRSSAVLNAGNPVGVITNDAINSPAGSKLAFTAAVDNLAGSLVGPAGLNWSGLYELSGLMSDELAAQGSYDFELNAVDARNSGVNLVGNVYVNQEAVFALSGLVNAQSSLQLIVGPLLQYQTGTNVSWAGEAYALAGYADLYMAEDFCAGAPLTRALPGGGVVYGASLSTDSLIATAENLFDSALARAAGNDTVTEMASIGLGRAELDRGHPAQAATAVASVATNFVYSLVGSDASANNSLWLPTFYNYTFTRANPSFGAPCAAAINMVDQEGGVGLNFISAADPRLLVDSSTYVTCDYYGYGPQGAYSVADFPDSIWYYPIRFANPAYTMPMATGIEARLIEAEAALASGNQEWLTDLNDLRTTGCTNPNDISTCAFGTAQVTGQPQGLLPLTDPGSDSARLSLLFRERAFWLYASANRLNDMRRLVRQYQRPVNAVYPNGNYLASIRAAVPPALQYLMAGILTYGTDVAFALPSPTASYPQTGNPNYKGCLTPSSQA